MLSKILTAKEAKKKKVEKFKIPSPEEIQLIIEKKKQETQKKKTIQRSKDEPVKKAKNDVKRILIEAREKLKEAEAEANPLNIQIEKELRTNLEEEYREKLQQQVNQARLNYFNSLEELTALNQVIYKRVEHQLMDLVFSVSHQDIGTEIKTSPGIILSLLKKGFDKIKERETAP